MSDSDKSITYVADVFGGTFIVQAKTRAHLRAHLVRRLRAEVNIRLATFDDGIEAERLGIETEVANATPTDDDDTAQQGELIGADA